MERFGQMVGVVAAAEEGVVTVSTVAAILVMVATVVTVGALLTISMWRNKEI